VEDKRSSERGGESFTVEVTWKLLSSEIYIYEKRLTE